MAEGKQGDGRVTTNTFVLANVPVIEDKEGMLSDMLDGTLPEDVFVDRLFFHPEVPDRVLVLLKEEIDLKEAVSSISEVKMEGQTLKVEPAETMNAVIAKGKELKTKLTPFFLKLYFQSEFADGEEVVTHWVQVPQSLEIAVHFTKDEVTRKVLDCQTHKLLPSEGYCIHVKPFITNFHGLIPYSNSNLLRYTLEEFSDSQQQMEDSAYQQTIEDDQSRRKGNVEEEVPRYTNPTAHLDENGKAASGREDKEAKEKGEREEAKASRPIPTFDNQMSNIREETKHSRGNQDFPAQDAGVGEKIRIELMETISNPKSWEEKDLLKKLSSSGRQALNDMLLSMVTRLSNSERDKNASEMSNTAKPEVHRKECSFTLNKALWKLMKDKIKKGNNEPCYDDERGVLLVKGQNTEQFIKSFLEVKERVKECHIPLDENQKLVLKSQYAKGVLSGFGKVEYIIDRDHLEIYGLEEWSFNYVKENVNIMIGECERIQFPNNMSDEDFTWYKSHYERSYPVHISSDDSHIITIIGKRDSVVDVARSLKPKGSGASLPELAGKFQGKESSIQFLETHYNLLFKFYGPDLQDALRKVVYNVTPGKDGKWTLQLTGEDTDVTEAKSALETMKRSIKTEEIDLLAEFKPVNSSTLTQRLSCLDDNDPIFRGQKSFETERKCIIKNNVKPIISSQATCSVQHQSRGPISSEHQKCLFQVGSSIRLEIKNNGNIAKENSNVLVCCSPQGKRLTSTFVGQAFCKVIPHLEYKFNSLTFSDHKVAFMTCALPERPVVHLAFVKLPQAREMSLFRLSVQEVLSRASDLSADSVCFPPLGHGRTMKYPESFISDNFLSALKRWSNESGCSTLRKITFLAPAKDLYEKMTLDAPRYFSHLGRRPDSLAWGDGYLAIGEEENGEIVVEDKNVLIQIIHRNRDTLASDWKSNLTRLCRGNMQT